MNPVPDDGAATLFDEPAARRRVRFVVAYDGSGFRGFATNVGVDTVVDDLSGAIELITRQPVLFKAITFSASRSMFRSSFAFQNRLCVRGRRGWQCGQLCQKQPCTNTATWRPTNAMSGRPGALA